MLRDAADRASAAFHGSWRWLAATARGGIVAERDGMLVSATGLPDVKLNPAYVVRGPADPHSAVQWSGQARAGLRPQGTGIDVPDGRWPRVEAALADLGYVERVRRAAMLAETRTTHEPAPAELALRVVSNAADWAAYAAIQVDVFGLDAGVAREFPPYRALDSDQVRLIVGAVDDEVVATAAVFVAGDAAGLYAVATREGRRRRGYGTAITSYAVSQAAFLGATHIALQASPEGYPVYRGLGFRDIGDWVVWVDPVVEP